MAPWSIPERRINQSDFIKINHKIIFANVYVSALFRPYDADMIILLTVQSVIPLSIFMISCMPGTWACFNSSPHSAASIYRDNIGSDNGLSPIRRQAIIYTNCELRSIGPKGTNFDEIFIKIQKFSFRNINLKITSAKWRPFCAGIDELTNDISIVRSCFHKCVCFKAS